MIPHLFIRIFTEIYPVSIQKIFPKYLNFDPPAGNDMPIGRLGDLTLERFFDLAIRFLKFDLDFRFIYLLKLTSLKR